MTTRDALAALGVGADTLTPEERAQLDRDGFLPLPGILTPEQVGQLRAWVDELIAAEGEDAGKEVHQEAGTDRLADLVNKGAMFDVCYTHPRVLAAIAHVLSDNLKLSSLNCRVARPGEGHQALHADWGKPVEPGDYAVCNSIWLLDDFVPENGATRVVPGTHRSGQIPRLVLADPTAPHPDEVLLLAPAGTVVVFNAHVWHGGTRNRTTGQRRALHSYFCRRDQNQQLNQRDFVRPETAARLTDAARYILDV